MQQVATSELRANLAEWIRRAREGEDVLITDRGFPVARLSAVDSESVIERLTREGVIGRPRSADRVVATGRQRPRPTAGRPVSDYVTEQRAE